MKDIVIDLPYGQARLTKGLDIDGHEAITARWERVKGNCRVNVSINMPPYQSDIPRQIWDELEPLISRFLASVSRASIIRTDDVTDADFRELPRLLQEGDR